MLKQRLYNALLFVVILSPWTAHGTTMPQKSLMTDAEIIQQARLDQNAAIATGNIAAIASFWTEDVSLRGGLGSSIVGKESYRRLFEQPPNEKNLIYVRMPDLIDVSREWPLAYESGIWTARRGSINGPIAVRGRYAAHWVKRDEEWLIRSEVFVALDCNELASHWTVAP